MDSGWKSTTKFLQGQVLSFLPTIKYCDCQQVNYDWNSSRCRYVLGRVYLMIALRLSKLCEKLQAWRPLIVQKGKNDRKEGTWNSEGFVVNSTVKKLSILILQLQYYIKCPDLLLFEFWAALLFIVILCIDGLCWQSKDSSVLCGCMLSFLERDLGKSAVFV